MQFRLSRRTFGVFIASLFLLVATGTWLFLARSYTPSPRNLVELRSLESRFQKVAENAGRAVVAVRLPSTSLYASGAIVSSDGLIVTSFHVSHRLPWDGVAAIEYLDAGHATTVILADGTECKAELLGADQTIDVALLKLDAPGPYPFLSISTASKLNLGDWVMELGHPTGLQQNRPPVVRIGRVLVSEADFFVSDCNITGGDSGGPIVNLDGEIVGIPSGLVANENHFGQSHYLWARNKHGSPILYSATPAHEILKKWGPMYEGKILPFRGETSRLFHLINHAKRILPDSDWTRGREVKESLGSTNREPSRWVVRILDSSGEQVALGTICSSEGTVVTLSSELPDTPRCQLHDGAVVSCDIIRKDKKLNLAILKVPLAGANSVRWDMSRDGAAVGTVVAAPLGYERSFDVGIVSSPMLAPMNRVGQEYFEIDMCLATGSCGGPIVNLDSEAIGISIRSHLYGAFVIPAAQVMSLLEGVSE